MSYHYSRALLEEVSALGFLDGEQCALLSGMRTAERSYFDGKKKASSNRFPSGTTLEHSIAIRGVEKWTSSLPDSHVSRSRSPENKEEKTTSETCGLKLPVSFAKYDHDIASWRTSQACLFTNTSEKYSKTWPRAGMIVGGTAYLRVPLAPRTGEIGSGLLPTPTGSEGAASSSHGRTWSTTYANLHNFVTGKGKQNPHWPTLNTMDYLKPMDKDKRLNHPGRPNRTVSGNLREEVVYRDGGTPTRQKYPTPAACLQDMGTMEMIRHSGRARKAGAPGYNPENKGMLNPDWVEWLMGWPTGWTDLEPLGTDKFRKWLELHGSY